MAYDRNGKFVWYELMSRDKDADLKFMNELVGWTSVDQPMGEGETYTVIQAGDTGIAGCMAMPAEAGEAPSHIIGYCEIDDIAAAVAAAEAEGAKVYMPITNLPDVGSFAVLADPRGAIFAGMQSASDPGPASPGMGHVVWSEIVTRDVAAAGHFYNRVFGWRADEIDMGGRPYWLLTHPSQGENNTGGMMAPPEGYDGPDYWLFYVMVADVDAATAKVDGLRGTVLMNPTDVPGQGRMSVIQTPSGATLALFTSAPM